MIIQSCNIKINTLNTQQLCCILKEWDDFLSPNLNSYVKNLNEYADKICKNAEIIEAYNPEGVLLGLLCIYLNQDIGFITHFVVQPEYQSQGIGTKLIQTAENMALERKIGKIRLECFKSNKQGVNFYVKNSYKGTVVSSEKILFEKILKAKIHPLVSICCATYNHKKYIGECLKRIISQKTNFNFEVLINDDASSDGTQEIIREYENNYPSIIKPIYQLENQYSKKNLISKTFQFPRAEGKYIALCDGDDYWCDEYKLQKQVDFLESHPDYVLCYHPAKMIYEDKSSPPVIIGKSKYKNPQPYYNLIKCNNIPASSVVYRAEYLKSELKDYPTDIYPGDWYTHITVSRHGKIGYLPDVMYVYRWHSQGISHTISDNPTEEIHLKYGIKEVNFSYLVWNKIKDLFPQYYKDVFINVLRDVYFAYLKNNKFNELEILQNKYSEYFKDIELNIGINKHSKKHKKYKKLFNIFLFISIILFCISLILLLVLIL